MLISYSTDISIRSVNSVKDFTYNISKNIVNYINIFDIPRDKDSSIVIMEKLDHIQKLETMINDGMKEGVSILEKIMR